MATEPVEVEVYSSYAYAVEPRAYTVQGERRAISELGRSWRTPGEIHFYVRDANAEFAELTYAEAQDRWSLRRFGNTCPPQWSRP